MAKILCPKGHEKVWFGNPCMKCKREEEAAAAEPGLVDFLKGVADASGTIARKPVLKVVGPMPSDVCPDECCIHCWEEGKEVEATSDDGTLCEEHVRQRVDMKRGDL